LDFFWIFRSSSRSSRWCVHFIFGDCHCHGKDAVGARIQQCLRTGCGGSAGGDDVIHQQHPLPFHELRLLRPEGTGRICQTLVQRESCLMASGPGAAERPAWVRALSGPEAAALLARARALCRPA
jgi:hypothetical protein